MTGRFRWRVIVSLVGLIVGIAAANVSRDGVPAARAQCDQPPNTCLPGSGYTLDQTWSCGLLNSGRACFSPGTRVIENANRHTWSWGSADYDGQGSIQVFITAASFGASGTNLTRACYFSSCNDQDSEFSVIWMSHYTPSGAQHTIHGHAKA
jgi:hypothetical protein